MKIFVWRFCHNTLPVRKRLRSKGVPLPIISPMCNRDVEHMLHVFFDCQFASQCWLYASMNFDMLVVTSTADWLFQKLSDCSREK